MLVQVLPRSVVLCRQFLYGKGVEVPVPFLRRELHDGAKRQVQRFTGQF